MANSSGSLESAMLYLETFAPDENRDRFEARINNLFVNGKPPTSFSMPRFFEIIVCS